MGFILLEPVQRLFQRTINLETMLSAMSFYTEPIFHHRMDWSLAGTVFL